MRPVFLRRKIETGSDEELLKRYRDEGDIRLAGQLYERYMNLVFGVCLKYLEEREWAKDEVMNIFEKLVTVLPQQQEISNFRIWLYVVTKNHCLMLLRSRKSEAAHAEAMMNDPLFFMENTSGMHPMGDDEGGETDDPGGEDGMKRLEECIERLREEQRNCIRLFFYEGCSYRQISERLGVDEMKVKSYIQNGKRNLKICMESMKV
ncbi:MAG TPA: sigma-70 family RNA polymerase sigma factor [Bacteroidales bacterium]|nr:sigma-70 family RNA polymerase sigma factor [Bacteroidales bacterium]HHU98685.1 sigma-70 family RNA polymerase sigma factor [Bacteroidales bacterium]HPV27620.1 sigma-70 family RNA polymerase sigma factor [Bacteroidales bacterium]